MLGERVKHVRELLCLTQTKLASMAGVRQSSIARIETGSLIPSEELIEKIAQSTGYPVEFFYQETDFNMPFGSLIYRRKSALTSSERVSSYRDGRQSYMIFHHLAHKTSSVPLRIPRKIEEVPTTAAAVVRSALAVDPCGPIPHLINQLERAGVIIVMLTNCSENLDGFSAWVDAKVPVIFLTPKKPGDRQRLTCAHELGHLILHFQSTIDILEKDAFLFAQELLFPELAAVEEFPDPVTLSGLAELKKRWGMSIAALIERARTLNIISENQRKYLRIQLSKRGWNKKEPIEISEERPRRMRQMAELVYGENINYRRISSQVFLREFEVKKYLDLYAPRTSVKSAQDPGQTIEFPNHH